MRRWNVIADHSGDVYIDTAATGLSPAVYILKFFVVVIQDYYLYGCYITVVTVYRCTVFNNILYLLRNYSSSSSSVVIYTQRLKTTVTRCWHLDQTNTSSTSSRKFRLWSRSDGHLLADSSSIVSYTWLWQFWFCCLVWLYYDCALTCVWQAGERSAEVCVPNHWRYGCHQLQWPGILSYARN